MDRIARARELRQVRSLTEARLWAMVRGRRLEGYRFRRQVPIGPYFADFVCMERRLVVEADGPSHGDSGAYDALRTEALEAMGFLVVRVANEAVLADPVGVRERLLEALTG
ncbi:MAG: endonuclease domain-containing protein [Caulobacter sp.]